MGPSTPMKGHVMSTVQFTSEQFAVPTSCQRYHDRVAIVTGGAQGLGRVTARRLADEGGKVVIGEDPFTLVIVRRQQHYHAVGLCLVLPLFVEPAHVLCPCPGSPFL